MTFDFHFPLGLHHVTATVGEAQPDYDFYTGLLGLRLVKQTVNFDEPEVYHFYYGNATGEPGSIMTTFPYAGRDVRQGTPGTGQVAVTAFSIPAGSLDFWKDRLRAHGIPHSEGRRFGQTLLQMMDPSGLLLELIETENDTRRPWTGTDIPATAAIRGLHHVSLSVAEADPTLDFLRDEFGLRVVGTEGRITRLAVKEGTPGQLVEVSEDTDQPRGRGGIGTVHHVAWRVADDEALLALRHRLVDELGFKATEVKDRNYFHSIYFRMPGKVLFEVATVPPGFTVDEAPEALGSELKLPEWAEPRRAEIERMLPEVKTAGEKHRQRQ